MELVFFNHRGCDRGKGQTIHHHHHTKAATSGTAAGPACDLRTEGNPQFIIEGLSEEGEGVAGARKKTLHVVENK